MLAGSGNKDYLYVYQNILPDLARRFSPDIILVSAGYDIHSNDHHANIRFTREGIRGMVISVLTCSSNPIVFTLEGGYHLESFAECVSIALEEMIKAA